MANRLSYENSYKRLQEDGWVASGPIPPIPSRPPRYDDDLLALSFFRTIVENAKMEDLTLPRVYFGRSTISSISFARTDLTESVANWNDFEDVDFSLANLTRFDFRGCSLLRVNFSSAQMTEVDLRCCSLDLCSFENTDMAGVKLTRDAGTGLNLSSLQRDQIDWQETDGEEPDGG